MAVRTEWTFVVADSLEKVFADEQPRALDPSATLSVFLGETASIQIAYLPRSAKGITDLPQLLLEVESGAGVDVQVSRVELVPATLLAFDDHDDGYLRDTPGLYPDLLVPLEAGESWQPQLGHWQAVWVDVRVDDAAAAGLQTITLTLNAVDGDPLFTTSVDVTVIGEPLPALDIVNTHWFHADSLAQYYAVEVFSEEHWAIMDRFVASAARMDANSLLTPTWTPPLDTEVGTYRLPVQLIGITDVDGAYAFDFTQLRRWTEMCGRHGIRSLEIAHLFTQWGAEFTPAIYVQAGATLERRFGWDVAADDPRYRTLLQALIPALRAFLAAEWSGDVIFHVSDEPSASNLESHGRARAQVTDLLEGALVVDALSDLAFAQAGTVDIPIVATDHVGPFLEAGVSPYWVYYCVGQNRDVANRFVALPSLRNRVLGHQIFALQAKGFLHWGFNFYNAHHSTHAVDPFRDTCANGAFPAGDPFIVYPGPDGVPWESIRFRVFVQAMADHRALQMLRDLTDFETARSVVDQDGALTYDHFHYDPAGYFATREQINDRIVAVRSGR